MPNPNARLAGPSGAAAVRAQAMEQDEVARKRKEEARNLVHDLAEGIVAINVPDELAWKIVLGWQNTFHLIDFNFQRLRAFIDHFPRHGLSASFRALLITVKDEQYFKEQKEAQEKYDVEYPRTDALGLALDGLELAPQSALAHRIATSLYLKDRDWLSCSEVATAGLTIARRSEAQLGITLTQFKAGLEADLAMALTNLHPPQHHARALRLCESALAWDARNTDTIMCKAQIYQASSKWKQARALFVQALQVDKDAKDEARYRATKAFSVFEKPALDARLEIAWCDVHLGSLQQAEGEIRNVLDLLGQDKATNPTDEAKAWWRLGRCLWDMGGSRREERSQAFTCFITALKKNSSFAPAFTSLGVYYTDVADPPDQQRAAKCFQKAFEFDGRQDEAARRLAEIYAAEEDWDLVDLVARRTVEAEGGDWFLRSGGSAGPRRHTTKNAWAWNAIGATELARGNFEKAIVALQVALRSFPEKAHIWMRLGEAYVASGRHSAAIKTFEKAKEFQAKEEQWQSSYSMASVQRELGMLEEAIAAFEDLARSKSDLHQIMAICAETRLTLGRQMAREGFVARASLEVRRAIVEAHQVIERDGHQSTAWKVVADGLFFLSSNHEVQLPKGFWDAHVLPLLNLAETHRPDEGVKSVNAVTYRLVSETLERSSTSMAVLVIASYVYKLRVLLFANSEEVAGSAWMDLGFALHTLYQTYCQERVEQDKVVQAKECQSQAIACVKEALKHEPGNPTFWCGLGNLVFDYGVPLAQHCFIKAIDCNPKVSNAASLLSLTECNSPPFF